MLFNITPSQELTGGPWFEENELDVEFINEMCNICLRFFSASVHGLLYFCQSHAKPDDAKTVEEVHQFVTSKKVSTVNLTEVDIVFLLNRLIYDGLLQQVPTASCYQPIDQTDPFFLKTKLVRRSEGRSLSALLAIPCGLCPVFDDCAEKALISPTACVYLHSWVKN